MCTVLKYFQPIYYTKSEIGVGFTKKMKKNEKNQYLPEYVTGFRDTCH
jgi:hypothetical protein